MTMCIVIDSNCLAQVCKETTRTDNFLPVFEWIAFGNGKLVFGGSDYLKELSAATACLKFFEEMTKKRKTVRVDVNKVDRRQSEVEALLKQNGLHGKKQFDDPHIVALIGVSGCRLICTQDKTAFGFFRTKAYYPKHVSPPKLYTGKRNANLLCAQNIAACCAP